MKLIKNKFQALLIVCLLIPAVVVWATLKTQSLSLSTKPQPAVIDLSEHNAPHYLINIIFSIANSGSNSITIKLDPDKLALAFIENSKKAMEEQKIILYTEQNSIVKIEAGKTESIAGKLFLRATSLLENNQAYRLHTTLFAIAESPGSSNSSAIELNSSFILTTL